MPTGRGTEEYDAQPPLHVSAPAWYDKFKGIRYPPEQIKDSLGLCTTINVVAMP